MAVLALPWGSDGQARAAISCIGAVMVLIAWLRPESLWEAGSTQNWRAVLGDTGFIVVYVGLGLAVMIGAWLIRIPE